eukprot:CAMPEP_0202032692 /NCGR_PEP_ID=MMETSP0905-20130828/65657_1 /ASSEMBLY_ACC=CAM_ASM_000554 /TAXON_ID=420261 /ORGANISM="Thalassiosira antarctica, Strain CCMP982" /LENGTH=847 /DNA_ID=CAMNT_0048596561 /DNA_START=56 /DNA_END=2600 /DNA_ORIENTATION=-
MTAYEKIYASLAKSLLGDIVNTSEPSSERATDILTALQKESNNKPMTVSILGNTKIGKILTKTVKACNRNKRAALEDAKDEWDEAIKTAEALLSSFKEAADVEVEKKKKSAEKDTASKKMTKAADAEAKQSSLRKKSVKKDATSKMTTAKNAKSGKLTKHGKAKQSAALKKKSAKEDAASKMTHGNNADSSGSKSTTHGKVKQSSALKKKTAKNHAASNLMNGNNADSGVAADADAKQSSALKNICAEIVEKAPSAAEGLAIQTLASKVLDAASKMTNADNADSDESNAHDKGGGAEDQQPPSLYKVFQRVYAKDDATGLLYPAFIRKVIWGPKSNQVNLGFCLSLVNGKPVGGIVDNEKKGDDDDDEDEDARRWDPKRNCYHYYVHYMGWNVKWDRWVEGAFLYEDSTSTDALAKMLTKEYNKVKPKRRGQKMSAAQVGKWMNRMMELEAEHGRLGKEGKLGVQEENGEGDDANDLSKEADVKMPEEVHAAGMDVESNETMKEHFPNNTNTDATMEEAVEKKSNNRKVKPIKKLNEDSLQKQAQLCESGLQMKRKRSISDRLTLPFNLKKILVEEWEVITQCDMVHNLPSQVSVREALNRYLENKLAPLREKHEIESSKGGEKAAVKGGSDKMQIDEASNDNKKAKRSSVLGKEWIDMVEGVAFFFDQALSVHLLFDDERSQYLSLRRQILAQRRNSAACAAVSSTDDCLDTVGKKSAKNNVQLADSSSEQQPCNIQPATTGNTSTITASESSVSSSNLKSPPPNLLPERMSEIYGCEHLLRLFVRLPAVVAAAPTVSELESRRIFSKLGDLVRYLQKHQSQLFCSSFRRPLAGESRGGGKKVGGK